MQVAVLPVALLRHISMSLLAPASKWLAGATVVILL